MQMKCVLCIACSENMARYDEIKDAVTIIEGNATCLGHYHFFEIAAAASTGSGSIFGKAKFYAL